MRHLLATVVLGAFAPLQAQDRPRVEPEEPPRFAAVEALLERAVDEERVFGISLVVVDAEGELHAFAAGTGDVDVALPIASATKVLTVTAFLTLVDRELVDLDAPVSRYLEDRSSHLEGTRVHQLLSCTSGFGDRGRVRAMRAGSLIDSARVLVSAGPLAPAGREFRYGGTGFQIAGAVAEAVGDESWEELVDRAVAKPLGMTTLSWGERGVPWLGGGARCSARDYARLLTLHLAEGRSGEARILSSEMVAEMRVDRAGDLERAASPFPDGRGYGLGWWLAPPEEEDGEVTEVSDPGAFGATPWIDLAHGFGAALWIHGERADRPARRGLGEALRLQDELRPLLQEAVRGLTRGRR